MMAGQRSYRRRRRSRKWSLGMKLLVILGGTLALVAVTGVVILASKLSLIEKVAINPTELNVSEEARQRGTGYLNVALFGVDSRENELGKGSRSDTIMIASLNRETLEIKISSVFRDTLMEQKDGYLNKANYAYSLSGPENAVSMLNKNLDMDIEHYVTVNFDALIDVVDAVGGVEIDVTEEEIPYVHAYAMEIMDVTGRETAGIEAPGLQTLNGILATAYTRIRYTAGDDFKRAERQRTVLMRLVEKLQKVNPAQLNKIIDSVFPKVATNFTLTEILDYAKDAFEYRLSEMTGFPFDKTTDDLMGIGSVVIPVTLESNVEQLHQFFYGAEKTYTVPSKVTRVSDKIIETAGHRQADGDYNGIMDQPDDDNSYSGYSGGYSGGYRGNSQNNTSGGDDSDNGFYGSSWGRTDEKDSGYE